MSQTPHQDIEEGNDPDDPRGHPQSTPDQPSQGESDFGDSSGALFSIYSKAAEEEDNKMVERWQKDADGILIFTGLFSAAVAALLAVTVQDLRPNSQDTSAFYLGNIYQVLADPNATRASIPSPVAKPPPFSAPRYAVWVNSLWFLSLVMSLSCALWATSLHQWARRYIRMTQPARCSPEKRARMRAYFAHGVEKMHIPWAVEGLPTLLHLSLFLFFGGLAIFLFNVDHEVFTCVVCWIGFFSTVYGLITMLPLIRQDSPYYTPLSIPAWFPYARISFVTFKVLASTTSGRYGSVESFDRYRYLRGRYRGWMLRSIEKVAEETASEPSSEIDIGILGWTMGALGDDDSLEKFFEAIPGLFKSKLVNNLEKDFPVTLLRTFWDLLDGFMDRTLSSNSVTESVKSHRDIICRDIMHIIPRPGFSVFRDLHLSQIPVSIEKVQAMARWRTNQNGVADYAQVMVAKHLARMPERNEHWIALASHVSGVALCDLLDNIAHSGDNLLLAIFIDFFRQFIDFFHRAIDFSPQFIDFSRRPIFYNPRQVAEALTEIDIRHTLPRLQDDFCSLWNKLVQVSQDQRCQHFPAYIILRTIRSLHIALHQGTDAFSSSTNGFDVIHVNEMPSYPLCNIASHRPDSTAPIPLLSQPGDLPDVSPHHSASGTSAAPIQVIVAGPPLPSNPAIPSEIGDRSQALAAPPPALLVHSCPRTTDGSPPGAEAIALQDIPPAAMPSRPTTTDSARLPLLGARGLVNTGNMCFVNATLQLLVHSPTIWSLFKELGDLKGQRGAGGPETGGDSATPLVDATVRFFEEFRLKEGPVLARLPPQQDPGEKPGVDEGAMKECNGLFESMYLYDAMKERRQLNEILDGHQHDAEEFFRLYLDALDEELLALLASISRHKSAITAPEPGVEEPEVSQSDHTEVENRGFTAESVESPLMRVFGGKFRSILRAPNQPDTVAFEDWRSLHLDIQHNSVYTIEDALARISHLHPVQLGPSGFGEASKQVLIEGLPPILVLHLKRFLYDKAADGIVEINKPVQFAPELEIPLEIMAPVAGKSTQPMYYKLYGVLYHHGASAGSGHYTVDVLHPNGDSSGEAWLHIDDEAVSTVRHEDVFGAHDNEPGDDRCAYMLFYCRSSPAWA